MGLEIQKRYSYSFHPMSAKRYEGIGYHQGIQAITFLGNQSNFKHGTLWFFQILTWQSMIKIRKLCNILKTADRTAKRMKLWDLRS